MRDDFGQDGDRLAVSYDVEANLEGPEIHVNPLCTLEPPFVRRLFGIVE